MNALLAGLNARYLRRGIHCKNIPIFFYENAPLANACNNFGVFSSKPRISKKPFGSVSDEVTKSGFDRHKFTTTNLKIDNSQSDLMPIRLLSGALCTRTNYLLGRFVEFLFVCNKLVVWHLTLATESRHRFRYHQKNVNFFL